MELYTKVFHSMLHSTIWQEPNETRIVWITMMLMSDQHGEVHASIPGLASEAKVSIPAVVAALERFQSPDEFSRTREFEGRRIEPIPGGWRLLNFTYFRKLSSSIDEREQAAERKRRQRDRDMSRSVTVGHGKSHSVTHVTTIDVDVDVDKKQKNSAPSSKSRSVINQVAENAKSSVSAPVVTPEVKKAMNAQPKEKKQLNGYNPIAVWCDAVWRWVKVKTKIEGVEAKWLTSLGNMYSEKELHAMLQAYGDHCDRKGEPWRLFEGFYKLRDHWRSKAGVVEGPPDPNSEAELERLYGAGANK